jgi:hypothetical protein
MARHKRADEKFYMDPIVTIVGGVIGLSLCVVAAKWWVRECRRVVPLPDDWPAHFEREFEDGAVIDAEGARPVTVSIVEAGAVHLPTGRVAVADPAFLHAEGCVLMRRVPEGRYGVRLSLATFEETGDARVGLAWIEFSNARPVRWEGARFEPTRVFGAPVERASFGVDSATACFASAEAAEALREVMARGWREWFDALAECLQEGPGTTSWGRADVDAARGLNAVVFSSGWGDGSYACWWGFDAQGEVCRLLVDLAVYEVEAEEW